MLTKEQIRKTLKDDPNWEPDEDANWEDWELYDEVCAELEKDDEEVEDETKSKFQDDDDDSVWSAIDDED